jgi:hypothetical protein
VTRKWSAPSLAIIFALWVSAIAPTSVKPASADGIPSVRFASQLSAVYPLKISADGRHLVDQNEVPFFINGDTPWSLIGQVSYEDAVLYIDDAAARRFNSLIVTLVESHYAANAPANYYNVQPYTTPGRFTTPNEAYFAHADRVINYAASKGIQIILAPNYLGCCNDGYWDELNTLNTEADARWFGEWVGNRYRNFPNLMYVWVNDTNPCGVNDDRQSCTMKNKIAAMASGVKSRDPNHLHTVHLSPENSPLEHFSTTTPYNGFTVDINATYTYNPVQGKVLQDYNRSPAVPFFLFETHYERDWNNAPPSQIRNQAYTAILSGAGGHHYGNNPIWNMGGPSNNYWGWKDHLNDEGRADMVHVRNLFESRVWYNLVPDQSHQTLTAGYGSETGYDYAAAARTADGSTVIAYLPFRKQITVDMSQLSGSEVKAWWFNPRDGSAQWIATYPTSGSRTFTPTSDGDWVLVLDDASKSLPPPGAAQNQAPMVNAGPDQTIVLPDSVALDATVSDDGLPGAALTVLWTKVSGPGEVLFGSASAVDTSATFSADGVYVLRLTANDGERSASDEVTIEVRPVPTFADVPFDHPYHDDIEALYQAGYTAGCDTNPLRYCPEATMNRAESAVFVERGIHSTVYDPPTPALQVFADLPLDAWAANWVDGLWQDKYTAGCGTNPLVYCPWQGHTRAEGCVFYLRMLNGSNFEPPQPATQTFGDVPLDAWYAKWVKAAYDAGLIAACQTSPELRFCPNDPLTRALAAHMMVQAKGLR